MPARLLAAAAALVLISSGASAQQAPKMLLEENGAFSLELAPERERRFAEYVESLVLSDREQRQIELSVIHQNPLWKLMSFIPLRLKPEVDTFFLRNDMRRDFNPVTDYTFLQPSSSKTRFSVRLGR